MTFAKFAFRYAAALIAILLACTTTIAQDSDSQLAWPNFRGPNRNGTSENATPPTQWSATENVAWKQKIPGRGTSSPIVTGKRVFLTSAVPADPNAKGPKQLSDAELIKKFDVNQDGQLSRPEKYAARAFRQSQRKTGLQKQKFLVLCYDRTSGDLIWEKTANEALPNEAPHRDHGYASASPVTDGKHLYVNFGSYGLYCYDLDGNLRWKRNDLGTMTTRGTFGQGSSATIFDNVLILPWDHEGQSYIAAINCDNGVTIWKTLRDEPSSWASPLVVEVEGRKQVLQSGQNYSRGYDFENGQELWKASGLSQRPVSCPVAYEGLGFFGSYRGGAVLQAIPLTQKGDLSGRGVAWANNRQAPDVPSLLVSENRLYVVSGSKGIFSCVNAETGEAFFPEQRLSLNGIYSSPVAADGHVFITGRGGKTVVIRDAVTFAEVSKNDIGEPVDATLALADREIFIRGKNHLFCIRNK